MGLIPGTRARSAGRADHDEAIAAKRHVPSGAIEVVDYGARIDRLTAERDAALADVGRLKKIEVAASELDSNSSSDLEEGASICQSVAVDLEALSAALEGDDHGE